MVGASSGRRDPRLQRALFLVAMSVLGVVYKGYGGKSGTEKEILYCVVTRLEIG